MLRKLFVFILLVTLAAVVTFAQAVSPKPDEEKAKDILSMAFSGGGSYMGVEIKEITKANFSEMGLSEVRGVSVSKVIKDSPAEKAGLQAGDVIVRFNGEKVTSRRKLTRMISEVAPDHKANLTVLRSGSEVEVPITIGKRPVPELFTGNFEFPKMDIPKGELPLIEKDFPKGKEGNALIWKMSSSRSIGIGVAPLTKQLADYFGIKGGKGLLINRVSKDSPAEKAGLRAGDVIIEIDGKKVSGTADLIRHIYEKKEGDLNFTVIRDKNRQTFTITPEEKEDTQTSFEALDFVFPEIIMPEDLKINVSPRVSGVSMPLIIGNSGVIL
jgi:serine protease Do